MSRYYKTLIAALIMTVMVYVGIESLGGKGQVSEAEDVGAQLSKNTRLSPRHGQGERSLGNRKDRQQKLSEDELKHLFTHTIYKDIHWVKITLAEALNIIEERLAEETPSGKHAPRVQVVPEAQDYLERPISLQTSYISAEMLVYYTSTNAQMTMFIYRDNIYLSPRSAGGFEDHFYTTERLPQIKFENIKVSDLAEKMAEATRQHEYFGPKGYLPVMMSEEAKEALMEGAITMPTINIDLKNATIEEAAELIAQKYGNTMHLRKRSSGYHSSGENSTELIYDPLKQMKEDTKIITPLASKSNYQSFVITEIFDIRLNEDWSKPSK